MANASGIEVRHDARRECGFRKPGGLYLVSSGIGIPCGRLPAACDVCPTCNHGIKPSRGYTWVDAGELLSKRNCSAPATQCASCPTIVGRHGLIWIGEQFYPTPESWMQEARRQGVSRRIPAIPNDFAIGEHWVLVAHRKGIPLGLTEQCQKSLDLLRTGCQRRRQHDGDCSYQPDYVPAIFHAFKPEGIEYVVRGDESDEELERLRKRGVIPVRVMIDGKPVSEIDETTDDDEGD